MKDFEKRFRFFNIAVAGLVVFMIFHRRERFTTSKRDHAGRHARPEDMERCPSPCR